jgi:hypothetical protein
MRVHSQVLVLPSPVFGSMLEGPVRRAGLSQAFSRACPKNGPVPRVGLSQWHVPTMNFSMDSGLLALPLSQQRRERTTVALWYFGDVSESSFDVGFLFFNLKRIIDLWVIMTRG